MAQVTAARAASVGTTRLLARGTAFLYLVGAVAGALLSLEALREGSTHAAISFTASLAGGLMAVLVAAFGARWPKWTLSLSVQVAAVIIAAGVAVAPTATVALAAASLSVLVGLDAMLFFDWREAWIQAVSASAIQVIVLVRVFHVGFALLAAMAVLWLGLAGFVGVLARFASRAQVDSLTGLANRRSWDAQLGEELTIAVRRGDPLCVALFDVDYFKAVNDERGHAAGDALLCTIADAWRRLDLPDVVLARRGGDEFAALMVGVEGPVALELTEQLRAASPAALSAGVAEHVAGESASELLRRTDTALYAAKAAGRGQVRLSAHARAGLAQRLAGALDRGEVTVALQPIVDLRTGAVTGIEALARWTDERLGEVPPSEFIPVAETSGLIVRLGDLVLRSACRQAGEVVARWQRPVRLSVNASGRELVDPGFADRLLTTLALSGWPADRLCLEVTESLVDGTEPTALATLGRLREHGVRVAIDDFGTGWSSLSRLDALPADHLKLDRSFITALPELPRRTAIVRALLGLCRELGVDVIAEGVESADEATLLTGLGCPHAQGYYFGRPMSVTALVEWGRAQAS